MNLTRKNFLASITAFFAVPFSNFFSKKPEPFVAERHSVFYACNYRIDSERNIYFTVYGDEVRLATDYYWYYLRHGDSAMSLQNHGPIKDFQVVAFSDEDGKIKYRIDITHA